MKKFVVFSALVLMLAAVVSACSFFKKPAQEAVNEGFINFAKVKKISSSLTLKGTLLFPTPPASPGEASLKKVEFSVQSEGKNDESDADAPKAEMNVKLSVKSGGVGGSGEMIFRVIGEKIYVNGTRLEILGDSGKALAEQFGSVLNKWWMLPVGEKTPFSKLSEEQKALKEKFAKTQFFINAREDAEEKVRDIQTTRYRVDLNKEAMKQFLVEVAGIGGNQVSPEEEQAIVESLNDVEFSGAVWVGDDEALHKARGTVTIQPKQGPTSSFDIDLEGWNYGEKVEVSAPEESQEFNPLLLFPLMNAFVSPEGAPAVPGAKNPIDAPLGAEQVKGKK